MFRKPVKYNVSFHGSVSEALIGIATMWKNGVGRKVGPFFVVTPRWTEGP